jgi:FkbM family methyltransferase
MSNYLPFSNYIKGDIKTIFELGSRDLLDSIHLAKFYNLSEVYAFECNPDGIYECRKNMAQLDNITKSRVHLIEKAIHTENSEVVFYPFDVNKYNNIGASSMFKIDFSGRPPHEEDIYWAQFGAGFVQKEIKVEGIRLDKFCIDKNIKNIDLICMDLQGYELEALKSLSELISNVKYIITECSFISTYVGGCSFDELYSYLKIFGFEFVVSDKTGSNLPSQEYFSNHTGGISEFNAFFVNKLI